MGQSAFLVGALAVLVVIARIRRTSHRSSERPVWRLMGWGAGLVAGASLIETACEVSGDVTVREAGPPVFTAGCALACGVLYQALIRWNRSRTLISDPGDLINGLSSVLVLAAILQLLVAAGHGAIGPALSWRVQLEVVVCSAALVQLGTAASVSALASMVRDIRIWLVMAALVVASAGEVLVLVVQAPAQPVSRASWLLAVALIAGCALMTPSVGEPQPATNQATIIGALVVLVGGLAVLTINTGLFFAVDHVVTAYAALGSLGAGVRVVRLVQDLAHLTQTRYEAMTDELTGTANRRALLLAMDAALHSGPATLLVIDLDRFKIINDRFGHPAGDQVLRHAAAVFAVDLPKRAVLARLGGDEFAVLVPDGDPVVVSGLAETLLRALVPVTDGHGRTLQVGASVGVSTMESGADGSELLHRADAAMYQAKLSGRGICVYDSELDARAQERLALIEELQVGLLAPGGGAEQFIVHFQPQIQIATGRVVGAEALVRWQHPRLGLLAPERFIDLVEENGLMNHLTLRVMAQAVDQSARWRDAGHVLRVSVNLSASSLAHPDTLAMVDRALRSGMDPGCLVLEITETNLMVDPQEAIIAMRQIADRGVGVSIDDYGTGYSSLAYLGDFPATELKIDRSFVARLAHDPRIAAIVAGTVELAHRLGLRLVAEGVENLETLALLGNMGCDESQGYLHSRPIDAPTFLRWLTARTGAPHVPTQGTPAVK